MKFRVRTPNTGFTLIELLISMAIMAILASLAIPSLQIAIQRSREQDLRRALWDIRHGIDEYKRASDNGRIAQTIGASGYPPSLEILVDGVIDQRNPNRTKIYFLRRLPRDPMISTSNGADNGTNTTGWGLRSYASEATDPKTGDDVYDVYTTSTKIGLNGVPYRKW